jgi:hypothetical protein
MIRHNEFVVNILEGTIFGKRPWEDLEYSTYSKSPDTQQLTVIQQLRNWFSKFPGRKLPTNHRIEG